MAIGYLLIKTIIIYGVGRLFKHNHENSKLTALNIAQGGSLPLLFLA
jgi:hypothetical protein